MTVSSELDDSASDSASEKRKRTDASSDVDSKAASTVFTFSFSGSDNSGSSGSSNSGFSLSDEMKRQSGGSPPRKRLKIVKHLVDALANCLNCPDNVADKNLRCWVHKRAHACMKKLCTTEAEK